MQKIMNLLTTENEFIYNIIVYPLAFLEFFVLFLIIKAIYKIEPTKIQSIIFISCSAIIGSSICLLCPMPFNFILNSICVTLLIMLILKLSFFKSIIPFAIFLLATAVSELVVTLFLSKVLRLNLEATCNTPIFQFICSIAIYSLVLLTLKIILYLKTNLNLTDTIAKAEKFKIIINVIIAVAIVCPNLIFLLQVDMQIPTYYVIYNFACALVLFILTTYNTHKFNKLAITQRELETANLYNNTLSQLVDMNRGFKHDISNIVQAIGGYVELNDIDGLKNYYKTGLLPEIEKINSLSLFNHETINSPPVFALLLSKYNLATRKDIKCTITSFFDYSRINMNIFQFTKIFGILLDNAIEASCLADEKHIDLHITVDFHNSKQIFTIKNTYKDKDVDIMKIYDKNYSSKEQKSGFGLWEVRQILNKIPNVELQTSKNGHFFIQKLEIHF